MSEDTYVYAPEPWEADMPSQPCNLQPCSLASRLRQNRLVESNEVTG